MDDNRAWVLSISRSMGSPTSMPWNDLYGTARSQLPGQMYVPMSFAPRLFGASFQNALCAGVPRRYIDIGVIAGIATISRVARNTKRKNRKLVIHTHTPSLALVVWLLLLFNPSLVAVTTIHSEWGRLKPFQRIFLHILSSISVRTICCGEAIVGTLPASARRRMERRNALAAIPNGIRSASLDANYAVDTLPINRSNDVVVVAQMAPAKNTTVVLDVFARLNNANKLIWFGDGPERDIVQNHIKKLGIEDRVILKGKRPRAEVFDALSRSSVYLSCSLWEGLSVADLEACALGCMPFLSKIPQHDEIINRLDLKSYDLDDLEHWRSSMDAFLHQDNDAKQQAASAIAVRTRELFDLSLTVKRYGELYASL